MSQGALSKVKATTAAEVCKSFNLKDEARPLLRDGLKPREFLDALLAGGQYAAGIDFVAHALPPREAVWWGCLCARHVGGPRLPPPEEAACKTAVQWVLDPTEDHRLAAQAPAEEAGFGSPAGLLARAALWTGGSLAPPDLPMVAPDPFMPAKAVAGAIMLAATRGNPLKITDTQRVFVEFGAAVAEGNVVWPEIKK